MSDHSDDKLVNLLLYGNNIYSNEVNTSILKGKLSTKLFFYLIMKSFKNDEKCFLFRVKSFSGSRDISF